MFPHEVPFFDPSLQLGQRSKKSTKKHKLITENGIGVAGSGIWPLGMGNEVLKKWELDSGHAS